MVKNYPSSQYSNSQPPNHETLAITRPQVPTLTNASYILAQWHREVNIPSAKFESRPRDFYCKNLAIRFKKKISRPKKFFGNGLGFRKSVSERACFTNIGRDRENYRDRFIAVQI